MAEQQPLKGAVLVDCAKANAKAGVAIAAQRCGYGDDTDQFLRALQSTTAEMGIDIQELSDLTTEQQTVRQLGGKEIAPDSPSQL